MVNFIVIVAYRAVVSSCLKVTLFCSTTTFPTTCRLFLTRFVCGFGSLWGNTQVGGFGLTSADHFHHLLFIPTLGLPGQVGFV